MAHSYAYMQKNGSIEGGRLKGLDLQVLQKRVQDQAAWALAKVRVDWKSPIPLGPDLGYTSADEISGYSVAYLTRRSSDTATQYLIRLGNSWRGECLFIETVQAKEKIQGRASEAGSCADAPGASGQDDSRAMEEGHASSEAAGVSRTKRLTLSALVMEVQKLTSALVKASSQALMVCIPGCFGESVCE